ncbi:MAG: hypothetical protein ACR2N2_13030 [Acidimicrobiia bacterium]
MPNVFDFTGAPVPIREDLRYAYISVWSHFSRPGPTLTGAQRIEVLAAGRADQTAERSSSIGLSPDLGRLADELYHRPAAVDESVVRAAADVDGDAMTVETISVISMLSSIDGTHRALGATLEPLPDPQDGLPTKRIAEGLKRRRTHIPVPPGPIPFVLDLLPDEGAAFQSLFGPQYMTGYEMMMDDFKRFPTGLNRAQIEIVSSRTSIINECFY